MAPMTDNDTFPPPPPPTSGPPNVTAPRRHLRRKDTKAAGKEWLGVCAGLAEYLGIPVSFLRVGFVIGSLAGGVGLLVYLVAAVLMPVDGQPHALGNRIAAGNPERLLAAIAAVSVTCFALLSGHSYDIAVAAILVAVGAYLWTTSPSKPTRLGAYPIAGDTQRSNVWPQPEAGNSASATSPAWAPAHPTGLVSPSYDSGAPKPRRRPLGTAVFAAGIAAMVIAAPFASPYRVISVGIVVLLLGMVAAAIAGRWLWGLVLPVLFLLGLLVPAAFYSAAHVSLNAGIGQVSLSSVDLSTGVGRLDRNLAIGQLDIDLRNVPSTRPLRFALGTGQIDLRVPSDVSVTLHSKISAGQLSIDGVDFNGGTGVDVTREIAATTGVAVRHLEVETVVGMGSVVVTRTAPEGGLK
jgi:phage shock protein PspC (stress-responsive transcriptional regulator)/dolichol kinase